MVPGEESGHAAFFFFVDDFVQLDYVRVVDVYQHFDFVQMEGFLGTLIFFSVFLHYFLTNSLHGECLTAIQNFMDSAKGALSNFFDYFILINRGHLAVFYFLMAMVSHCHMTVGRVIAFHPRCTRAH